MVNFSEQIVRVTQQANALLAEGGFSDIALNEFIDASDQLIEVIPNPLPENLKRQLQSFVALHAKVLELTNAHRSGVGTKLTQLERTRSALVRYAVESHHQNEAKPSVASPLPPVTRPGKRNPL